MVPISPKEFYKMISDGRFLVILEGQVLDIEKYMFWHPGGVFVLNQRIGFNLDLPFNGFEYSGQVSSAGDNPGYMHSNEARLIAQSLIIGKYEGATQDLPNFPEFESDNSGIEIPGSTTEITTVFDYDYNYEDGMSSFEPTNGWTNSSHRKHKKNYGYGQLHFADQAKVHRLDELTVIEPMHKGQEEFY